MEWQINSSSDCQRYLSATKSYKNKHSLAFDNFICWGWQHYLSKPKCICNADFDNALEISSAYTFLVKHWHIRSLHLRQTQTHRSPQSCKFSIRLFTITSLHIQPCRPPCSTVSWLLIHSEDLIRCTNYTKWNVHLDMAKTEGCMQRRARGSQLWQKSPGLS